MLDISRSGIGIMNELELLCHPELFWLQKKIKHTNMILQLSWFFTYARGGISQKNGKKFIKNSFAAANSTCGSYVSLGSDELASLCLIC